MEIRLDIIYYHNRQNRVARCGRRDSCYITTRDVRDKVLLDFLSLYSLARTMDRDRLLSEKQPRFDRNRKICR